MILAPLTVTHTLITEIKRFQAPKDCQNILKKIKRFLKKRRINPYFCSGNMRLHEYYTILKIWKSIQSYTSSNLENYLQSWKVFLHSAGCGASLIIIDFVVARATTPTPMATVATPMATAATPMATGRQLHICRATCIRKDSRRSRADFTKLPSSSASSNLLASMSSTKISL